MKIGNFVLGKTSPVYFIADIAANHDGSLERAKELIYMAAESGAHAAKFQHFKASTIVSDQGFLALGAQLSHQSKWKKSVYEVYKDASVNLDWTLELQETCKKAGITFFTTPYSLEVVDFIDPYVPAYKIGSGDITWHEIVEKVASQNKPYILATGASSLDEVSAAVSKATKINPNLLLMQCNTNYSASLENFKYINLNVLKKYSEVFPGLLLGLSDHTQGCSTVLGAIALGAVAIEKHFTDDNSREGPDHLFSMNPASWREMVDRSNELSNALGSDIKKVEYNELETVIVQRRALRAKRDIEIGELLDINDFSVLRPCPIDAAPPYMIETIKGKPITQSMRQGDYLTLDLVKSL